MTSITVHSPAKINLFLHITGRRADGYHNLQTLFQFLDWHDDITITINTTGKLTLETAQDNLSNDQNLIIRAAQLLQSTSGSALGAHFTLLKRLPMGGGLGGGSSNAASTLVALNQLWNTGLSTQQLQELGLSLGADVPIFIHGHAALAQGVGEQFESVHIPQPFYLMAIPDCHASTADLFQEKQLTRDSKIITIRDFLQGQGHNDFEPVLRKRFSLIDRCLQLMNSEGKASVTGSGACLFMPCDDLDQTLELKRKLKLKMGEFDLTEQDVHWHTCKGRNQSPLYSDLSSLNVD